MDILSYTTVLRNFNSDDLLPDLRALNHEISEVTPTRFMSEMQLSTEQRHERLIKLFYKKKTCNKGTIDIVPPIIIFQNYQEGFPYTVPLTVINNGKTSCYMKLLFQYSPYFSVIHDDKLIPPKLAPGMEINFIVQFIPEENKDYWHQVKIFTDNEEYTLSLIAIGPRPLLNLPDDILFPDSPVKIESEKHIIVRNTGLVPAVFNIHTKPPFSVTPLKGVLESNETTQFLVKFKPNDEGTYIENITVNYETGEKLVTSVQATAICTNIFLNKRKVQFDDTYIGLQCHKTIELVNKSNHVVHFAWKMFDSSEMDKMEGDKIKESFNCIRDHESKKSTKLETYNVIDSETNEIIYDRIYKDEITEFNKSEQFLFYHTDFSILPQTGDIGANHSTDITVTFSPNHVQPFETLAYCDVTGRVERLPLKLCGVGIGPKFTLNLDSFDMNNVFLYTDHCFEVVVCNDGDIEGKLSYVPREYDFGIHISCEPVTLQLKPFEHGAFDLHFHCSNEGSFIEEIHFCVEHSEEIIKLLIKGKVLYPLLTVNITNINFGYISLGFPVIKPVTLINNTPIEIPFEAYIYPDGTDRATVLNYSTCIGKVEPAENPKEYEISPSSGVVPPNSSLTLKLTLVANICRLHSTTMFIETWNTTKHRLAFQLIHNGRIPDLLCTPADINIRFCFLDYLCHRLIVIKNKSSFTGYMHLYGEKQDGLNVLTDVTEFRIEPYGITEISLNIICTKLGLQSTVLKLHLFGGQPMVICKITCIGQGPVLSVIPEHLNFGHVKLLEDTCKIVSIYNDSPIGAAVTLQVSENSPWKIEPTEAYLEPEESRDINVCVYLNNTKKYRGSIFIDVRNRGVIECNLSATGVGTCIQVTPPITPVLDLGAQLTKHMIKKQLVFANKGVRHHKILIASQREIKSFQQYNVEDYPTLFSFIPNFFSLCPDESITVTLSIQHDKIQRIEENFYIHAIIDNKDKKQIIMETTVMANFVEPVLAFSKKEMSFSIDFDIDTIRKALTDVLEIKNNTPLVLEVDLQVQPPFYIELNGSHLVHHVFELHIDETYYLTIFFDSSAESKHCFVVKKNLEITYRGHPRKDHISLKGEVNYPNIQFNPELVDFGAVTDNSQSQRMVELKNISPLPVRYHFEWLEDEIVMNNMPPVEKLPTLELKESLTDYSVSSQPTEEISSEHLPIVSAKSAKKQEKAKKDKPPKSSKGKKPRAPSVNRKSKNSLPIENIFQQYAIETVKYPDQIQIYQELREAVSTTQLMDLPEGNKENLMHLKQILYPFVENYATNKPSASILQCLNTTAPRVSEISRIIEIIPSRGYLEPFESQFLSLSYRPMVNTSVKARVLCHVRGGPTETLDIVGMASDISYYLNRTSVDFGRQVFCEVSQKSIKLVNTGYIPFTFTTTAKEPTESQSARLLEVGWFTVQPQNGTVFAQSEMELLVRYYPGIAGKFSESFQLEIGHLAPVTITVSGYGVFSQVHLNLPRPSMRKVSVCTCYTAVANITPDYLMFVDNIKVWTHPEGEVHVNDMSKEEKCELQKDGWVVISYSNKYPSAMDIDLAIERMLAYEYITQHPEILADHSLSTGLKFIPRFYTPAYQIDFGYVITDTMVHYTVLILNYGSTSCKVRVVPNLRKSGFLRAGFNIQYKGGGILVGDTEALYVIFCPTQELYPTRRQSVKFRISLEVEHGPRIPITVKAIVTVPFIETSTEHLDFDQVICGQRKMMNFFITNTGYVPCTWEAKIEKNTKTKPSKCQDTKNCIFYLTTKMGYLEPGEKILLDVYFEPRKSGHFEWKLQITLDQNPEKFPVLLNGDGVKPWLKINEQNLEFIPSLPYSNESVQCFTIENPCSFPIEFFLSEFDEQIFEEETIIRLLRQYYSSDTLYIPQRLAGEKLPQALYNFYEDLLNELRSSLTVNEKDETFSQATTMTAKTKKVKKRRGSSAISSLENIRTSLDPLENKSADEIEAMLKDLLANKLQHNIENTGTNLVQDPIEASFKQLAPAPLEMDSSTVKEGILIVYHGAPFTESVYAANRTAKKLNLPVSNINHLILEALAYNENVSCTRINEIITNAYSQATDNDVQILDEMEDDPYKKLERKIQFLTSHDGKKKHSSAKGSAKSSKSGKSGATADSKKTKGRPGIDNMATLLGIPQELLTEVLKEKLQQYKLGIVIESLNNIFMRTPILTLMCLLKTVGNLKYIHCFLLYNSMQAYQNIINDKREAEQVLVEQKKNEMLEHFDSITEEEFDSLSPDYLELYKNTYLAKRKAERQRRLEEIRKKSAPAVSIKVSDNKQRKKTDLSTKISISTEKGRKDKSSAKKSDKSSSSSKKTKKTVKLSPELQKISKEFESFLAEYRHMLHVLEFWDRKPSILTKDYTEKASKKTDKSTKKKGKDSKPASAVTAIPVESETTIGVPCWIVNSTNNDSQMIDVISMVMHDFIEYQTAREGVLQSLVVKLEPTVEVHSILKQPVEKRTRTLSEVFTITSGNEPCDSQLNISNNAETNLAENTDDKTEEAEEKSIAKGQDTDLVNDKLRKSKTKKRFSLASKQAQNPTEPPVLKKRLVLQPGDVIKYRIRFTPKTTGCYQHSYGIEMVGWDTLYTVNCQAHCDIPKIDLNPKTLFTNVVKEKNPHNEYRRNMFIKNTGTFEFGNSFLCNHHGKHWDRTRKNKATIHVKNISLVCCEITTHILEDTGVYQQAESHLIVHPHSTHNLTLSACPAVLGPNPNILALSLKHNPRIELVPLNCTGCKIEFEILNKKLTFERVLLGHKEQRVVTFINYSMVPIHWEFTNCEMFTDKFHIVPQYGDIRENDCIDITIDYNASEVDVMPVKKLYMKILEQNDEDEPLLTEFIEISAETRDILVDCVKSINFGEVKARKNHTMKYDFMNNGKYNILFEISELSAEEVDKSILTIMKMFKISHLNGTLLPGKEFNTIITFNSQKMIDIKDYPIFKCNLMDHISRNILSTFYITATVKTFYSLFEVYPTSEINFGAMLVGTQSSQKLTITNIGRFPFDYTVTCKRRMSTVTIKDTKKGKKGTKGGSKKSARKSGGSAKSKDSKKSAESKKSAQSKKSSNKKSTESQKSGNKKSAGSKKSGSKKSGSKKSGKPSKASIVSKKIKGMLDNLKKKEIKLGPPISCGTFEIKNAKGTIKPEETAELEVECSIMDVGSKEEKILISVSESAPKDTDGRIITLSAIGCIPSITFNDYTNIFKEHFIVQSEDDFVKPKELENHCVFIIEDEKLVFNNVCINTTSSAQIQLYNNSLVEAELSLKSTLASVFAVNPSKLYIPSYTHGQFTVTFSPTAIETYKANLELHLAMPEGQKSEVKTFHLFGEGRVPEISLIKPESMDKNNNYIIIYEPTLVDKCARKLISFVNSGDFPCKVICEICDDTESVFSINATSSHSDKLKLIPNEVADINVMYHPSQVALNKCKVRLHIVNNPFEVFTIKVTGTAYSEDIVLEDIPTCTLMDNSRLSSISLISDINNTSYILNFDNVNMNSLQKKKFKILNRSTSDIYKFIFKTAVQEVSFIPAVGHLRPEAYKEIIVTFLTDSPVTYDKFVLECMAIKIQYTESTDNNLSWDERQKLLIWNDTNENSSDMLLDVNGEPEYIVVNGHVKKIPVLLSAKADYATYECANSDVLFKDTMMFEKRTYAFTVFNTSSVNLEVNWNILLANTIRPTSAAVRKNSRENVVNRRPETARSSSRPQKSSRQAFRPRPLTGQERLIEQCKSEYSLTSTSTTRSTNSESFYMPFTINPEHVIIPAGQKYEMTVVFAPLDVYEYKARLKGHITNLSTAQKHIDIGLAGKSLMPYCYFEVRLSDYISSGRRTVDNCDDILDVDTKVVEFDCIGVGISHEKSFNIINPTEDDLVFSWEQLKSSEISSVPLFSCAQLSGTITRGKMTKATFNILPQTTGTFEALYNFKLESYNFTSPFLFVANIREPKIYLLQPYLNIKPTVYGISVCDYITLKNEENIDLNFKFRKSSLFSETRKESLTIEPRTGVVRRLSETQIKICFKPTEVGEENFTLKCNVDFCKMPLVLGVQTVCYKLEPVVSYMVTSGNRILLNSDKENVINLGTLSPNQTETITFYILNIGKTGFYYSWKLNNEHLEKKLNFSVTDKEGYVKKDTEINTMLKITSSSSSALKNYQIELKIKYGPKYKIFLNGSSTNAVYKFSFLDYDFGPCLVQNSNICYNHKTLEFVNNSLTPLTLENTFNNTEYLSIDFQARQIMPKTKESIPICFHPRKCQKYHNEVMFLVNCQPVKLKLRGEGVDMNICLLNSDDKYIQLGAPEIGQLVTRTVQVFNRSATDVQAYFDLWDRLPIVTNPVTAVTHYLKIPTKERFIQDEIEEKSKTDGKKGKKKGTKGTKANKKSAGSKKSDKSSKKSDKSTKSKKSKKSEKSSKSSKKTVKETEFIEIIPEPPSAEDTKRQLLTSMITITPKGPIKIASNKMAEFVINYLPTKRLEPFSEKISVQVHETVKPLCIIEGRSLASDFRLDRNTISFGVAVLHCYRESKLTLINDGDIGSRFSWNYEKTREFSITPIIGYSGAGTSTVFNIMFCPSQIGIQSKCRMECDIKDYKKKLYVDLIGMCCDLPAPLAYINFKCPVRTEDRKTLLIHNSSGQDWKLSPIISGDYFTTNNDILQVPAKSSTTCEIVYKPLLMSKKDPHTGSIFFKIPDGKAILYNFEGTTDPPAPIKIITLTVPCKTKHTEVLTVTNWSRSKQQFKVYTEDITPGDAIHLYETNGQEFIDILGNGEREYSWLFYAYKECSLEFRIIFMNDMKEYMFYKLLITVTKCKPLETITLTTCARTPVTHELTLINPLTDPIVYKLTSTSPVLTFKSPVTVDPYSEISTVIEYNPLLEENSKVILEATCAELGTYPYEFELCAHEAVSEPELKFITVLGDVEVLIATVKNLTKNKASFVCKIDDENSFTVDKLLTITANQTSNVPVTFTPYKLGNIKTNLTISSPTAGEFIFPLFGICQSPKPKGPFILKPDSTVVIDFYNPFLTDITFIINVKPNTFTVKATEEFIKSKTNAKITVKMVDKLNQFNSDVSGKLLITPKDKSLGDVKWIYYLQGCIN